MRKSLLLAKKDLKIEFRSRHTLNFMLLFSFVVLLMFNFASDPFSPSVIDVAPGLLWFVLVFAALLGLSRAFIKEKDSGTLEGLKAAPVSSKEILLGKMLYNLVLVFIITAIAFPLFIVLFNYSIAGSALAAFGVIVLGSMGLVVVGSLVSALILSARSRELVLQVVALPLLLPVIIPTILALRGVMLYGESFFTISEIRLVLGYILIMATLSLLLFEYVMEE